MINFLKGAAFVLTASIVVIVLTALVIEVIIKWFNHGN